MSELFAKIKLENNKTKQALYSNTTWLNEEGYERLMKIYRQKEYCKRASWFVTSYLMYEAVSRLKFFAKYPLKHKAAIVLVPGILAYVGCSFVYDRFSHDTVTQIVMHGNVPFWKKARKVPELDKVFFELDDHLDFRPNILHHGLSESQLQGFFPELVTCTPETIEREFNIIKSSPDRNGYHHGVGWTQFNHHGHAEGHGDHGHADHSHGHEKHGDDHHDKNHH